MIYLLHCLTHYNITVAVQKKTTTDRFKITLNYLTNQVYTYAYK